MIESQTPTHRLYLALYVRDGIDPRLSVRDDRYHWAFLATSNASTTNQAIRIHTRDYYDSPDQTHWMYEEMHVDARGTPKLLAQLPIGDVYDMEKLFEILRDEPVVQGTPEWNCVMWIKGALDSIKMEEGVVEGGFPWTDLRDVALSAADTESFERLRKEQLPPLSL